MHSQACLCTSAALVSHSQAHQHQHTWTGQPTALPACAAQGAPLSERLHALSQQLLQTVDSVPGPSQAEDRSRPMTFAQKRRLSARLGSVTPDLAHRVLEIVAEDPAAATGASGVEGTEVELEMDQLQPDTLWRIRDLLDGRAGGAAQPAMVAAAGVAPMPQQGRPMMAGKTPGPGGAGASAVAKGAGMMDTNGGAMSVQSSGAGRCTLCHASNVTATWRIYGF